MGTAVPAAPSLVSAAGSEVEPPGLGTGLGTGLGSSTTVAGHRPGAGPGCPTAPEETEVLPPRERLKWLLSCRAAPFAPREEGRSRDRLGGEQRELCHQCRCREGGTSRAQCIHPGDELGRSGRRDPPASVQGSLTPSRARRYRSTQALGCPCHHRSLAPGFATCSQEAASAWGVVPGADAPLTRSGSHEPSQER